MMMVSATRSTKRFSLSPRLLKLGTSSAARAAGTASSATDRTVRALDRFFMAATPPERWEPNRFGQQRTRTPDATEPVAPRKLGHYPSDLLRGTTAGGGEGS